MPAIFLSYRRADTSGYAGRLAAALAALARFQAIEISDTRWDYDVNRLVAAIARLTGAAPKRSRRRVVVAALAGAAVLAGALLRPGAGVGGCAGCSRW